MCMQLPALVGGVRFLSTFKHKKDSTMGAAQVWRSVMSVCVDEPKAVQSAYM